MVAGLSASNNRTLKWFLSESSGQKVPDFNGSVHSGDEVLPIYSETQRPESKAAAYIPRLIFPQFEKLTSKEVRSLKPYLKTFTDSIEVKLSIGIQRKKQVLDLSFCPFIKRGNDYFKLVSFDWDIKPVTALRTAVVADPPLLAASNEVSVLSSGKWNKISVTQTGMYKLTYTDIKGMGIDPEKAQIYGYGGALLEEKFSLPGYQSDLPEVAVWKEMGADGIFNEGDYILFFAQGPISWKYDKLALSFKRVRNHYSDKAYYFVGERSNGTRTTTLSTFSESPTVQVNSFTDRLLHETERVNMGESVGNSGTGRQLYGEDFTTNSVQTFSFDATNLDTAQLSSAQVDFVAKNTGISTCRVYVNNSLLVSMSINQVLASDDYKYACLASKTASFKPRNNALSVKVEYLKNGNSTMHRACMDYIALNVNRYLKMNGSYMTFRDPKSVGVNQVGRFNIQNANGKLVVFDVTNPQEMVQMNGVLSGTDYSFDASVSTLREYVAVDLNGTYPKPTMEGSVPNQNIHGHSQVDMTIIVPQEFMVYADKLAEAHATYDNLSVLVVTPEQVYNEFSSGTPDATAYRRMMKHFYDKAGDDETLLPRFLLLFGDGVYDNRLVSTMFANKSFKPNKLLTYQSVESLDNTSSYVTDDYFGFLDSVDGANLATDKLDIGIGRFPVSSLEQAKIAVDKTISYMSNQRKGVWKNRLLYLADDGNDYIHEIQADALASSVENENPEFMISKIYVDGYPKVTTVSGSTVPDANKRFKELLNAGLLTVNYTGHGSTTQWAEEMLLTIRDIKAMTNKCLPLFVTATCDFTRFDSPEVSAGEEIFLNPNGGGIGLFTTTRLVYSSSNFQLNQSFGANIFYRENGKRLSLGEIMNRSKGSEGLKGDSNKLSFTLIGDPALKLAYPQYSAKITQINGKDITAQSTDTLHALSTVTISGEIFKEDNTFAADFNGVVCPTVMDAKDVLMSWKLYENAPITKFYDRSKVLFSGRDSVRNGKFTFTFVVPKDISYSSSKGSINLYAYDNSGANEAQGFYQNILLSGTDNTASDNKIGPDMELFLNDFNYKPGKLVNETPTLLARISDENGLNTSGNGIGHDLILTIDGNSSNTYNLNSSFSANTGSFTSGIVSYVLPELTTGKHHLTFKAWDVQNNSTTDTLWFDVLKGLDPSVTDLKYAQMDGSSFFWFTHDRPEVYVGVELTIYDLLGRLIWTSDWRMQTNDNLSDRLEWNLTDTYGRRVTNGIYICKVLFTDSSGAQSTRSEKIQILGQ